MKRLTSGTEQGEDLKPFLEHLEDLRVTLIRSMIAIGAGMIVAFPATPWLLGILKRPLKGAVENPDTFLQSIDVAGAFVASMRIAFWGGLILSTPALVVIVGSFLLPALTEKERGVVRKAGWIGVGLFGFGVILGYLYTMPFALSAMLSMNNWLGVTPIWTLDSYVAFTTRLLIAFGLAFELPLVILVLGRFGVVSGAFLAGHRKHAVIACMILATILTPPDVVSQIIMTIPMVILYEICIWIVRSWERKK